MEGNLGMRSAILSECSWVYSTSLARVSWGETSC